MEKYIRDSDDCKSSTPTIWPDSQPDTLDSKWPCTYCLWCRRPDRMWWLANRVALWSAGTGSPAAPPNVWRQCDWTATRSMWTEHHLGPRSAECIPRMWSWSKSWRRRSVCVKCYTIKAIPRFVCNLLRLLTQQIVDDYVCTFVTL